MQWINKLKLKLENISEPVPFSSKHLRKIVFIINFSIMGLNNNFHSKSDNTSWFWQNVLAIFSPKIYKFNNCTNVSLYNESCVQQGNKTQSVETLKQISASKPQVYCSFCKNQTFIFRKCVGCGSSHTVCKNCAVNPLHCTNDCGTQL